MLVRPLHHYLSAQVRKVRPAHKGSYVPAEAARPIREFHPVTKDCLPDKVCTPRVKIPSLIKNLNLCMPRDESIIDVGEWLGLVALQSPQVAQNETLDPYLCRYSIPLEESTDGTAIKTSNLVILRWSGLIPAHWLRHLFVILW